MTAQTKIKLHPMPAGGFMSDPITPNMVVLWTGRGSYTLYLAGTRPGGLPLTRIEPDRFQHDGTPKGAKAAALAFIAEGGS